MVASSTSNHDAANGAENNSDRRISFAKISEPLKVPNLLAIQTDSFDRLVGNERWAKRLENAQATGDTSVPEKSGLAEIFEEIFPRFVISRKPCSCPSRIRNSPIPSTPWKSARIVTQPMRHPCTLKLIHEPDHRVRLSSRPSSWATSRS